MGGLPKNYHTIKSDTELGKIAREISSHRIFTFDTETSGLNAWKDSLYCVSLGVGGNYYLVNFAHDLLPRISRASFRDVVGPYFNREDIRYTGFNTNFDRHFLEEQAGIKTGPPYFDASTGIWLIHEDARDKKLKHLAEKYLNYPGKTYEELFGRTAWISIDAEVASYYAIKDAELHELLYQYEVAEFEKVPALKKLMFDLEMPCQERYYRSEREGFLVDEEYLEDELIPSLAKAEAELRAELIEVGLPKNVNPDSPEEMSVFLFGTLGLRNWDNGSTNKEVLEKLKDDHPIVPIFKDYRETTKIKGSFGDTLGGMVIDRKIHPSIKTIGSETGRISVSNPNLLQMPSKVGPMIRRMFVAPPGYILLSKDLSGQELRIMAGVAGDRRLTDIVTNDGDLYAEAANIFYGTPLDQLKKGNPQRDDGKKAVLAQNYGAQAGKMAAIFKCSKARAQKYLEDYDARFIGVTRWKKKIVREAKAKGYVETALGRRRHLDFKNPELLPFQIFQLERQATNAPIQGGAADQIKLAFLMCSWYCEENGLETRPLITIHDEILFLVKLSEWCPEMNAAFDEIITTGIDFKVPMVTQTEVYFKWGVPVCKWGMKDEIPPEAWSLARED